MTLRSWLVLLLFCLWSGASWYWYTCKIKGFCLTESSWSGDLLPEEPGAEENSQSTPPDPVVNPSEVSSPLVIRWGAVNVDTSEGWSRMVAQISEKTEVNKVLEISAPYQLREIDEVGSSDVGVKRALAIKHLLAGSIDTAGMVVRGEVVQSISPDSVYVFEDVSFRWITNNEQVKELTDGALIYFPYKSDERIDDPTITNYLKELAGSLIAGDDTVEVIGHTDDKGSAGYNLKLGQERADAIKGALVDLGVPAERIIATSKGESEPLAPNISEENKAKNRRTEIKIK